METFNHQKFTKMKHIIFLIFIVNFSVNAQYSNEYINYKNKYPDAHAVRLNQERTVRIKLDAKGVNISQEFLEEELYLDKSATSTRSKKSINFSSFFELEDVEASSFNFEDGKYKELKVKEFKEKNELDNSFYDDTKSLNFIYSNLKEGSKSILKYSEKVKVPRFLSPFYFGDFMPIINNKVTIIVDKNISIKFQEFNTEKVSLVFGKKEKNGYVIYTWEVKNREEYKYEQDVPTYKNVLPHIIPIITSYVINGEAVHLANNVSDLYNWYYSLVKGINKSTDNDNLVALVQELTNNKSNDLDKVKSIYYWVQKNIKYIAFEYALGGFIPREANDVFQKKYGDCKDNSSILYKMLEIAGLKGELTWIGTRSIPYTYEQVPTPIVDNHMILSYNYDGITYFLDATGRFIPIDMPTSFIQGKEALISNGENYILKKVPIISARKNAFIDVTMLGIDNEILIGKSKAEISGYSKIDYFNRLENKTKEEEIKEFYNNRLQKGNNKFLIESYTEINKYDYDKNLVLNYNFNIKNHAKKLNNEIYINLNLNKELSNYKTDKNRENDIEYRYKSYYNFTTFFNIPEGYEVEYVPADLKLSNEYLATNIEYEILNKQIKYNHTIELDFLNLNRHQQKEVNALIKKAENGYKEIIILKKQ